MVGEPEHTSGTIVFAKGLHSFIHAQIGSHVGSNFFGRSVSAKEVLEVSERVCGVQVGLSIKACEFRERIHNAHHPFDLLSELCRSCIDFKEVHRYYLSWVRAVFEPAMSVLVFWVIDGSS